MYYVSRTHIKQIVLTDEVLHFPSIAKLSEHCDSLQAQNKRGRLGAVPIQYEIENETRIRKFAVPLDTDIGKDVVAPIQVHKATPRSLLRQIHLDPYSLANGQTPRSYKEWVYADLD